MLNCLLSCAFILVGQAPEAGVKTNIVVILADDLGWADLACQGGDLHETPHLDRLARQGVRFTQAYAASPVCSPTRAALLTGIHPARSGITIWRESALSPPRDRKTIPPTATANLSLEVPNLASQLKRKGYTTALVGKWHLGDASHFPENLGFDIHIGGNHWGAPATFFAPYRGLFGQSQEPRYVPGLPFPRPGEYLTDRLTDEALAVLDKTGSQPFFLMLTHYAPHTPIEAKADKIEKYRRKIRGKSRHRNPSYAAMVESLDESVGRVLDLLERMGLAKNTLVLFTSDNGGYVGEYDHQVVTDNYPLRSGKGSLYEGGIRVPLIIRWPGISREGGLANTPVTTQDLYQTILAAAGQPPAQGSQAEGLNLEPILRDPGAELPRQELYWHYPHYYPTTSPVSAGRFGDWKLLEYLEDGRLELFNLREDPGESRDLAPQYPEKAARYQKSLATWRQENQARMPLPNPAWKGSPPKP